MKHQFSDKVFFIDCNPDVFKIILNWIRFEVAILEGVAEGLKIELMCACQTFKLETLSQIVKVSCVCGMPITQKQILTMIGKQVRHFDRFDVRQIHLEKLDLSGLQFLPIWKSQNLQDVTFRKANL